MHRIRRTNARRPFVIRVFIVLWKYQRVEAESQYDEQCRNTSQYIAIHRISRFRRRSWRRLAIWP